MIHWTAEDDATIVRMAREGVPVSDIARAIGRSASAVYHRKWRLGEASVKRPNPVTNDPKIVAEVLRLYNDGYPYREIMRVLKITKDTVSRIIAENVKIKRSKRAIIGMRIYSNDLVEKVRALVLDEDLTHRAAAERLRVKPSVVTDICTAHRFLKGTMWSYEDTERVRDMLTQGKSREEIATRMGRTLNAVAHKCDQLQRKRRGITKPLTLASFLSARVKSSRSVDARLKRPNDIDLLYVLDLYARQNGKCHYTGRQMTIAINDPLAVSIDRVDSSQGHVKGNVVLCGGVVNVMKMDMTVAEFVNTCALVVEHQRSLCAPLVTAAA